MGRELREKLVLQTQAAEPDSRALCGLYSVNNALQMYNFLDMAVMREELCRLEVQRPGEDHGSSKNGEYSIYALHGGLQKKGYRLIHLNRYSFLYKKAKKEWASRLISSSFSRLLIIGKPAGQVDNIYHCIASTMFKKERWIIDPDEGSRARMTKRTLAAFLPKVSSVYAIVTIKEHGMNSAMFRRAKAKVEIMASPMKKPTLPTASVVATSSPFRRRRSESSRSVVLSLGNGVVVARLSIALSTSQGLIEAAIRD